MNDSHISIRYAKALFELAKEKNILKKVYDDIILIEKTLRDSGDLKKVLKSPIIATSKKQQILSSVFAGNITSESTGFLNLILKNKRETYLDAIVRNFISAYKEEKGIKTVKLTTAVKVSQAIKDNLAAEVGRMLDCKTEMVDETNPDIIGGFVLRIQDLQYNASVSSQLKKIKQSLTKA